ncbi:MAG TPA: hypothetical protein VG318_09175 [Actinomycetota bacterium]|nr:hypothetical protein [Actinomycetota bacterium]
MNISSEADLIFWQSCQTRVAGYLTTNGLIEISLCGLYATTLAVLVALGQSQTDEGNYVVFNFIIPSFSLIVLSLSANVYTWIRLQIEYLAIVATHPTRLTCCLTYEEWKSAFTNHWARHPLRERRRRTITEAIRLYALLPLHVNNIYRYYFLIYTSSGLASMVYAVGNGTHVVFVPALGLLQLFFLASGTHDAMKLAVIGSEVRETMVSGPSIEIEDIGDDY